MGFVIEIYNRGELLNPQQPMHKMSENEAKFYFCELASALHYLHDELSIVYRYVFFNPHTTSPCYLMSSMCRHTETSSQRTSYSTRRAT
jgi:serine/threonine protein kinase